jgi:cell division inhibitor SepF
MASGLFKKTMVYLGLVDDEYDETDGYEPWAPQPTRQGTRVQVEEPEEQPVVTPSATIRTLTPQEIGSSPGLVTSRTSVVRSQPVIVNLQLADRDLMRRIIDFCSGVAYAIDGKMERVADKVFLVTPQNVRVSAEERQRLQENGLVRV